jgi:hypothetical protein
MKRFATLSLFLSCLSLVFTIAASTQIKLGPKDGSNLKSADLERIKIGDEAPDFTLENLDGKPVMLSEYRDRKSVVLVFYRGYW